MPSIQHALGPCADPVRAVMVGLFLLFGQAICDVMCDIHAPSEARSCAIHGSTTCADMGMRLTLKI